MTYKINGTEITLQPTLGKWLARQQLGVAGSGHSIYAGVREFELRWQAISPAEYNQLQTFYNAIESTGTAVVDLPEYGAATYTFESYTGCVIYEPEFREHFTENLLDAVMLITNIVT